jgi:hypothetical protein
MRRAPVVHAPVVRAPGVRAPVVHAPVVHAPVRQWHIFEQFKHDQTIDTLEILTKPITNIQKVYLTIFAGRERYLNCLIPYLDTLLKNKIIHEVHLWDYTRTPSDSVFIQEVSSTKSGYKYIKPTKNMRHWDEYYNYYITAGYNDNDILIKCDDDVVYIDTDQMSNYLKEIRNDGLYFPNIVNNDVCAYIQSRNGIHDLVPRDTIYCRYNTDDVPLTNWDIGWYMRYDRAAAVHSLCLKDPSKFKLDIPVIPWQGRISINMFAGRYSEIKKYFTLYLTHGRSDDEAFFSYNLYKHVRASNYIVPYFNIVHFSFHPQNTSRLDSEFLEEYAKLAREKNTIIPSTSKDSIESVL